VSSSKTSVIIGPLLVPLVPGIRARSTEKCLAHCTIDNHYQVPGTWYGTKVLPGMYQVPGMLLSWRRDAGVTGQSVIGHRS